MKWCSGVYEQKNVCCIMSNVEMFCIWLHDYIAWLYVSFANCIIKFTLELTRWEQQNVMISIKYAHHEHEELSTQYNANSMVLLSYLRANRAYHCKNIVYYHLNIGPEVSAKSHMDFSSVTFSTANTMDRNRISAANIYAACNAVVIIWARAWHLSAFSIFTFEHLWQVFLSNI